ncbi:MAG: metal ABC transporter permease, partial [Firmicutes bacterium]|nr:metal ABC transporter permease [Bacillota bacterium]
LYHPLILYLFDEEYAKARGINVGLMQWVVYLMIPIGIIVLVKVVGIILTIALMTIPVSIAKLYFKSVGNVVGFSMLFSFIFSIAGITLAYYVNIPSGACIVIVSTAVYLLLMFSRGGIQKRRHRQRIHSQSAEE